jgi:uncharacterized membrane protein YqgA involved in biofilm formation
VCHVHLGSSGKTAFRVYPGKPDHTVSAARDFEREQVCPDTFDTGFVLYEIKRYGILPSGRDAVLSGRAFIFHTRKNMVGTFVNAAAIIAGSSIGLGFKKSLPEKYQTIYFQAVGLFTLLLGVKMALGISSPLLVVLSLVLGGFVGLKMRLSERTEQLGELIKTRIRSKNDRFTEGLITGFLLFCMGSMTIVGAIEEGFGKTSDLLLTKSVMDFFSAIMLASGLGIGVLFSSVLLLLFQGGITLLVSIIGKDIPPEIISEITVVGGIILIGLSINLLNIKQIEIINLLPALLFICLFVWLAPVLERVISIFLFQ